MAASFFSYMRISPSERFPFFLFSFFLFPFGLVIRRVGLCWVVVPLLLSLCRPTAVGIPGPFFADFRPVFVDPTYGRLARICPPTGGIRPLIAVGRTLMLSWFPDWIPGGILCGRVAHLMESLRAP
jgi:hypothetical protein